MMMMMMMMMMMRKKKEEEEDDDDEGGEEEAVFIKVPEEIATINLERDVTYAFKIRVGEGGVNVATAIKKP